MVSLLELIMARHCRCAFDERPSALTPAARGHASAIKDSADVRQLSAIGQGSVLGPPIYSSAGTRWALADRLQGRTG
jgi:hypothetical protein